MNLVAYFSDSTNRKNIADYVVKHGKVEAIKTLRRMFYMDGSTTGWDVQVTTSGDPFAPVLRPASESFARQDHIGLSLAKFLVDGCVHQFSWDHEAAERARNTEQVRTTNLGDLLRAKMDQKLDSEERARSRYVEGVA